MACVGAPVQGACCWNGFAGLRFDQLIRFWFLMLQAALIKA